MVPASPRSADTRRRLLEAAADVFAEHGFRSATIQEICRRAGANIAAVNYHFADKERLYRAVLRHAEEACGGDRPPELPAGTTPEDRLRAHVEWFLLHLLDEGRPAWHGRLMAREMIEPTDVLDELVEGHIRESHASLLGIVREILGPRASEAQLRSCAFSITGQCVFYHNAAPVIARLYGGLAVRRAQVPGLAAHITGFSLAALRAIAAAPERRKRTTVRRPSRSARRAGERARSRA